MEEEYVVSNFGRRRILLRILLISPLVSGPEFLLCVENA